MKEAETESAKKDSNRARIMEIFYFLHVPVLVASLFLLEYETFVKVSLLYTTTVSAITAAATYGAKGKASDAEAAGYENP